MNNKIKVTTPSGNSYIYTSYPIRGTNWNNIGGIYMFARLSDSNWNVLYVGQTNNFAVRFANHEKLPQAIRYGATHILARVNNSEISRKLEEAELIGWQQPICNDQLK